ncbi:hypothetical protein [Coraliomargarita sinensis]|uniref:hypothetical protein n=1 Tax=Coraliomargarita sinensis TaxID=2174842 RepID=UPI0018EEBCAE|nr:hypothetical protein [Coraliomargarita sinensis]
MLNVVFKNRFKKDLKKLKSSNRDEDDLLAVIDVLANEQPLEEKLYLFKKDLILLRPSDGTPVPSIGIQDTPSTLLAQVRYKNLFPK